MFISSRTLYLAIVLTIAFSFQWGTTFAEVRKPPPRKLENELLLEHHIATAERAFIGKINRVIDGLVSFDVLHPIRGMSRTRAHLRCARRENCYGYKLADRDGVWLIVNYSLAYPSFRISIGRKRFCKKRYPGNSTGCEIVGYTDPVDVKLDRRQEEILARIRRGEPVFAIDPPLVEAVVAKTGKSRLVAPFPVKPGITSLLKKPLFGFH